MHFVYVYNVGMELATLCWTEWTKIQIFYKVTTGENANPGSQDKHKDIWETKHPTKVQKVTGSKLGVAGTQGGAAWLPSIAGCLAAWLPGIATHN